MTSRPGSSGARTAAAIRRVGLRMIYKRGFEAMSLRELAAEVGIQAASLYHHISTKQDLLFGLIHDHMTNLLEQTDAVLARARPSPTERLRAFAAHHMQYHLEKKQEVFVANFELRALEQRNYAAIVTMRREYEARLIAVLEEGQRSGELRVSDSGVAAYAILAMLTGACTWYKPEGRLTRTDLIRIHAEMALGACGVCTADGSWPGAELAPEGVSSGRASAEESSEATLTEG